MNIQLPLPNLKRNILTIISAVFASVLVLVLFDSNIKSIVDEKLILLLQNGFALFSLILAIFFFFIIKMNDKGEIKALKFVISGFIVAGVGSLVNSYMNVSVHSSGIEILSLLFFAIIIGVPAILKSKIVEKRSDLINNIMFVFALFVLFISTFLMIEVASTESEFLPSYIGNIMMGLGGLILIVSAFHWNRGVSRIDLIDKLISVITLVLGLYALINMFSEVWSTAWWALQTIKTLLFISGFGVLITHIFQELIKSKKECDRALKSKSEIVNEKENLRIQLGLVNSDFHKIDQLLSELKSKLVDDHQINGNQEQQINKEFEFVNNQIESLQELLNATLSEFENKEAFGNAFVSQRLEELEKQFHNIAESFTEMSEANHIIYKVVNQINEMEDQSNLLAINTAIEAVKAGELGRGMSIVAEEIKILADMSKEANQDILTFTKKNTVSSKNALNAAKQGDAILGKISNHMDSTVSTDRKQIEILNRVQNTLGMILTVEKENHLRYINSCDWVDHSKDKMRKINMDTNEIHFLIKSLKTNNI
ncbi:MAG: hypothetical protein JEZ03_18005 [Bacteroidales bacterium]|nr:hypothetical protein [Bacteroidales bacterium]